MRSSKSKIISSVAVISAAILSFAYSSAYFGLPGVFEAKDLTAFPKFSLLIPIAGSPIWRLIAFQTPPLAQPQTTNDTGYFAQPPFFQPNPINRFDDASQKEYFKNRPAGFSQYIKLDSTTGNFVTYDKIDNYEISYPYEVNLDNYLQIRKKSIENGIWDSITHDYDIKHALTGGDLARMLSASTGLTIPVPPNPIISLFGKPEININVNGEVNIKAGWRWDSQNLGTVSSFGQTQSSPIFSQDIKVNVTGRIGDKFKLSTDWNTRRQFEYDNKFKVGFEGEDDDIIKLIELGNVNLPLPTTLITGGQTLFGLRADFQFGKLFLKTIAAQKRGERKFVNVKGGSNKQYFQVRAYDYARNHFFLDTVYKSIYKEYFKYSTPVIPSNASKYRIKEIEVWESTGNVQDGPYTSYALAHAELEGKRLQMGEDFPSWLRDAANVKSGYVEVGHFMRLDSTRYKFDPNLGTLTIYNLRTDRTYAAGYRTEGDDQNTATDDIYNGNLSTYSAAKKDTLILKLICSPNMQPGFNVLWSRQMKNIYQINATNVNVADTRVAISYINQKNDSTDVLEGAPDKLVTILRVDQVNNSTGSTPPDGQYDLRAPFFDSYRGELTFPSLEPFREGLREYFTKIGSPQIAEQYVFNEIYDTTYEVARKNTARDRFIISGEVSGTASNRIMLGAYYLAPGSVKVTLDGVPLREYDDYIIDYNSGSLTMKNQRALLPNANLKIEYEQQDIFNLTTKTLLGLRADYNLFKNRTMNANLGFTAMYYDQSALIERVRLGEEPSANTMLGLDFKFQWETPWLTKLLDYLPFYDTKAPSSLSARGEWALSIPEPNKKRSDVLTDGNEPVVYIDDFEGAQRYIPLSLSPFQWQHCSQPQDEEIAANDSLRAMLRGRNYWYQFFRPRVPIKEVYPERSTVQGRSNLSPLYIKFNPNFRGIYNMNPEFLDTLNPNFNPGNAYYYRGDIRYRIWGGMMRLLSSFNTNFDNENIEYIEIMMKVENPGTNAKMFIDLGQISEDVIPNKATNTEDGITEANPMPNNIIDAGEDVGIDSINNAKEKEVYPYPLNLENDPARDNYFFDFNKDDDERNQDGRDFVFYNNFEGNASQSEMGQFPDTEVLNKNNGTSVALSNSYFTYEVNLDGDVTRNSQIVGVNNEWRLYRIPIRKPTKTTGSPLFSNIQYIRVWFKGDELQLAIADWKLVGSQWQRVSNVQSNVTDNDSVLQVGFINVEENSGPPDYYAMPPGVQAPAQNNIDPNQIIRLNEQSLFLQVRNLRYGDERMAVRYFRSMDMFNYKTMKLFIHGDGTMPDALVKGSVPKAYMFIRFGIDSMNYYEYRCPVVRGWESIEIPLENLTAIKQIRDETGETERQIFPVSGNSQAYYAIRGNPILTRVQFVGLGISNPSERYPNDLSTTVWIDELRLLSPESSADWAGIANVEMKLADLGSVNLSISNTQPNFHRLEERFGNRINTTNWVVTMQGNLEKFAPKSFKEMKVPITYTHSEYMENPLYVANSDINLAEASSAAGEKARQEALADGLSLAEANRIAEEVSSATTVRSQTLKVADSWALTGLKLGIPTSFWLVKETVNKLTLGYSYSQEFERNPVVSERFWWMWQLSLQYTNQIPDFISFKPIQFLDNVPLFSNYSEAKINILPVSFSASLNMTRKRTTEQSRYLSFPSPVLRDFNASRQAQASWKLVENGFLNPTIDYSFTTGSTLVPFELDENGTQRSASEISSLIFFNDGLINLGKNNTHTQTVTINMKPRLPLGAYIKFVDMTGQFNTTYNWQNPLQPDPTIADIAKSVSFQNNIRLNTSIKLRSMSDQWYGRPSGGASGGKPMVKSPADTSVRKADTPGKGFFADVADFFKLIFLDYDKFDINFTQTNNSQNPGVYGGEGMTNFWARGMTFRSSELIYGPTMAYQLGLVTNPHGGFNLVSSNKFPFFGFESYPGLRPPNAVLQDNFSQKTSLEFKTTRPLWEGATLDLNWKNELAFNKNQTVITDDKGVPHFTNVVALESFNKTFLRFPKIFGLNVFNCEIEHIIELFEEKKAAIESQTFSDSITKNRKILNALSESFHDGLEAFSLFGGNIGKFLPAVNWTIRWEGIEKWDLWGNVAKKISFEHSYVSKYTETAQTTDNGRAVQSQQVQQGFQPLIGVTMSFDEKKLDGVLTATLRWNATSTFQLTSANRTTITKQASTEIQAQASYTLKGFDFPLFGIILKNDLEFSFLASYKTNQNVTFDISGESYYGGEDGRTLNGNTQITIEPRVRYSMSDHVSASYFFRYEGTFTEGAASPGFSSFQTGLDIRISLSGGR